MAFWVKHAIAAVILLVLALLILLKPDLIGLQGVDSPAAEDPKATANAPRSVAAQKFTSFYEQLRYALETSNEDNKKNVIDLPDTSKDLQSTLEQRAKDVPPLEKNWKSKVVNRKFSEGSKVREQMMAYAQQEGIELIWTLPKDYVVKHYFESEKDYLNTLKEVISAISTDFEKPVGVYFCPRERAAVVTDRLTEHLLKNCRQLNRTGELQRD